MHGVIYYDFFGAKTSHTGFHATLECQLIVQLNLAMITDLDAHTSYMVITHTPGLMTGVWSTGQPFCNVWQLFHIFLEPRQSREGGWDFRLVCSECFKEHSDGKVSIGHLDEWVGTVTGANLVGKHCGCVIR